MNDISHYRIEVIDWREGVLKLHTPDGTSEDTIMLALCGPLHAQASEAVAVARRASVAACRLHRAMDSCIRLADGPDAGAVVDVNTPGNIRRIDVCECGARRETFISASYRKQGGTWI